MHPHHDVGATRVWTVPQSSPRRFHVYRLTGSGGASWVSSGILATTPGEALVKAAAGHPALFPEGETYFVVDPTTNPNHEQSVFTLKRAEPPLRAVPQSI